MFYVKDGYAIVWSVEDKGNYINGRISTSEKDNRTGEYINSSWFVRFVGKAKEKALTLQERDRIKILSAKITNPLVKLDSGNKYVLNVTIFDFDIINSSVDSEISEAEDGMIV